MNVLVLVVLFHTAGIVAFGEKEITGGRVLLLLAIGSATRSGIAVPLIVHFADAPPTHTYTPTLPNIHLRQHKLILSI